MVDLEDGVYIFKDEESLIHFMENLKWASGNLTDFAIKKFQSYRRLDTALGVRLCKKDSDNGYSFNHASTSYYIDNGYRITVYVPQNLNIVELI